MCCLAACLGGAGRAVAGDNVDPDTEFARRLFAEGGALYDKEDYEGALRAFQKARVAKPIAAFEFNIARCLDRLGRWEEALHAYERFSKTTKDPAEVAEVSGRIKELRERVAELKEKPADQPLTAPSVLPAPLETPRTQRQAEVVAAAPAIVAVPSATRLVGPAPVASEAQPAGQKHLWHKWWFWTAVGGVAAAGLGVGLGVGLSHAGASAPTCSDCALGGLKF